MHRAICTGRSLQRARQTSHQLHFISRGRPSVLLSNHASINRVLPVAPLTTTPASSPPPTTSMNGRKLTLAFLSGLVLGGAIWYSSKSYLNTAKPESARDYATSAIPPQRVTPPTSDPSLRKVVAVDEESLYTASLPISKKIEDSGGKKVLAMLTPEEASQKLRQLEESYNVGRGMGVWRYDVVQIPSNNPIEDDHAEKIIEVPYTVAESEPGRATTDWMFWGVFDGHSGWTTSAKLRQVLIGFVARELNETYKAALSDPKLTVPTPESIETAIKRGFVRLDNEIVNVGVERVFSNPSKLMAAETLAPALSGSCALLAFYESRSQLLRVACTGDSRAVLGRRGSSGKWTATPLSVDQTGSNDQEVARMRAEHPDEPHVIRNGRVLGGLEPSRAFGDAFYKWSYETQLKIKNSFFGRTPTPLLKTPPYVTAEPVVTTTKIEPDQGDFVVMATDGLWEMLTNEEVVGLVGRWLEENKLPASVYDSPVNSNNRPSSPGGSSWLGGWFGGKSNQPALPVEPSSSIDSGQKTPIRMLQWGVTAKDNDRFVFQDKNAATHLVRNALGGKDKDMVCALLTLVSPYSRRYRDDLTVEVIFFGNSADRSGNITINEEATAIQNFGAPAEQQKESQSSQVLPQEKAKL